MAKNKKPVVREKKDTYIMIRTTRADKEELNIAAADLGMALGTYVMLTHKTYMKKK